MIDAGPPCACGVNAHQLSVIGHRRGSLSPATKSACKLSRIGPCVDVLRENMPGHLWTAGNEQHLDRAPRTVQGPTLAENTAPRRDGELSQ